MSEEPLCLFVGYPETEAVDEISDFSQILYNPLISGICASSKTQAHCFLCFFPVCVLLGADILELK